MTAWFRVGPDYDSPRGRGVSGSTFSVVVCEARLARRYVDHWKHHPRVPVPKMTRAAGVPLDPGGPAQVGWKIYEFDLDGLSVSIAAQHVYVWTDAHPWLHEECFPGDEPFVVFEGKWQKLCLYKPHAERLLAWLRTIAVEAEQVAEIELSAHRNVLGPKAAVS